MKCSKCGSEIVQGQTVCPICGETVMSDEVLNDQLQNGEGNENALVQPENNMEAGNAVGSSESAPDISTSEAIFDDTTLENATNEAENISSASEPISVEETSVQMANEQNAQPEVSNDSLGNQNVAEKSANNFSFGPETTAFMNNQNNNAVEANDPVVSVPTSNETPSQTSIPNSTGSKNKKVVFIIIGAIVVLVAAILAFVFLFKKQSSPKSVFTRAIDNVADAALLPTKQDNKKIYEKASVSFNVKTPDASLNEVVDIINKFDFSVDTTIDYDKKIFTFDLLTNYGGKKLIAGDAYGENDQIYIHSADLYDKYIKVPVAFSEILESNSNDIQAYEDVVNEIREALKISLKDEYFKSTKEKITVDGKEVSATKNELDITKDNFEAIKKDCLTYLKNSSKFISGITKLSKQSESDVKDIIDEGLKDNDTIDELVKSNYSISIYTTGAKSDFVKLAINDKDKNGVELIRANEHSYEIVVTYGSVSYKASLDVTKKDDKATYKLKFNSMGYNIELKTDMETAYNKDVVKPNISNAIDVSSISEDDLMTVITKLQSNQAFIQLMTDLQNIKSFDLDSVLNSLDL